MICQGRIEPEEMDLNLVPRLNKLTDLLGTGGGIIRESSCKGRDGSIESEFSAIPTLTAFSETKGSHILSFISVSVTSRCRE